MSAFTVTPICASTKPPSPLVLQDISSDHVSIPESTLLPSLKQSDINPNKCVIIIQNNYIAEGGTINIFSSHCTGSAVTKLDHVAPTAEPTLLQPPLLMQPEPTEHGSDNIVFSGNSLGECVMINVESPNCVGAVKQTVGSSQVNRNV